MISPENRFTNYDFADVKAWEQGIKELYVSLQKLQKTRI